MCNDCGIIISTKESTNQPTACKPEILFLLKHTAVHIDNFTLYSNKLAVGVDKSLFI